MANKRIANQLSISPRVVGTIHSWTSLKAAMRLKIGQLDFLEVRVDAFLPDERKLLAELPKLKLPLIVTVRHPAEGGAHAISVAKRSEIYRAFLPFATYLDIELRSVESLAGIILGARKANVGIILSYHNFRATPSRGRLQEIANAAVKAKADILKIATVTSSANDLATLLSIPAACRKMPFSIMGMGRFGKISRLLLAQAGSSLNYGYLTEAQVSGQWPAILLKKRIEELIKR